MTSKKLQTLSHHFRMLWSLLGWRLPLMLILTALGTLIDGVGLALFLPLFGLFQGAPNPQPDKVLDFVTQLMHFLGVPVEMGSILVLIVAVFFLKGAIKFAESAYMGYMKSLVPMQLQSRFIHAFFRAKHSYSVGLDSGSLVHLSGGEISLAVVSLFQGVAAVAMLCSLLAYTGITTVVDYRFTLAAAFAGVLPILVFRLIQTKTKKASRRLSVSRVELQGRATELLQNGKYLKATGNSEKLLPLFEAELAGVGQNIRQVEWLVAWTKGVREPLLVAVAGVMVFVWRIWHPSIEGMVFIFLLLYRALTNLMGFQVAWQGFLSSSGAIDIVLQHIADLETHAAHCGNQAPQSGVPTICFRGVGVNFGDRPALSGIHLDIQPNEFIVLLGPSGAGKSTFVNLLTGLIEPNEGQILFNNMPLRQLDGAKMRQKIGYITQENVIFNATIRQNITLWTSHEVPEALIRDCG
ncbi:MAG: ABC transporter ATP-binding protein, partial [Acidobacteria bacterium]|nr:ABC transporter ATP-binding protein [Acidobacteriota bacterium]